MFGLVSKKRELLLEMRIKELENLLCPADQHDYCVAGTTAHLVPTSGTAEFQYTDVLVCKRCFKRKERTRYCL